MQELNLAIPLSILSNKFFPLLFHVSLVDNYCCFFNVFVKKGQFFSFLLQSNNELVEKLRVILYEDARRALLLLYTQHSTIAVT